MKENYQMAEKKNILASIHDKFKMKNHRVY